MDTQTNKWKTNLRRNSGRAVAAVGVTAAATIPAHAQISNIVIGGIRVGGAAAIAAWLI